jgi:protein TonB
MNLLDNEQKMLDILFAKRNKNYGAYAIRSAYGSTIFRSLFIVAFTVASSIGLATWLKENHSASHEIGQLPLVDSIRVVPFDLKKDDKLAENKTETKHESGGAKKNDGLSGNIKNNALDTAKQVVTSDPIVTNTTATGDPGPATPSLTGGGTATTASSGGGTDSPSIFVDESPEFEGGHAALLAFVRNHLVYPTSAIDEHRQGTVYAKFVVDETGKVSSIFLQNNLGYGLDDEAMRVLKMIPKFKSPGKVQGKPVKTYYQIPIKFKLG